MTIALILFACPADLSACRRDRIEMSGGYASAMQTVAEWVAGHPGYAVLRFGVRR